MSTWEMFADVGNNFRWHHPFPKFEAPKAAAVYGDERYKSSNRLPSMADLLLQGCSKIAEETHRNDGVSGGVGLFRNGFGRPVAITQSSLAKASSLLRTHTPTPTPTPTPTRPPPTGQLRATNTTISHFQTGSGKTVNLSPHGLVRAKTLLGLEDDDDDDCNHQVKTSPGDTNDASLSRSPVITKVGALQNRVEKQPARLPNKPSSVKFHTAGGRSISVSTDAFQRARSLLRDPDLGNFLKEGKAGDSGLSFSKERKETAFSYPKMIRNNFLTKTSVSPLQSLSNQVRSSAINWGTNLISQFDVASYETVFRSNRELAYRQKPLSNKPNYSANGVGLKLNSLGWPLAKPLTDISNTVATTAMNNTQVTSVKRRLGRSSVSPFKKPRCSNSSPLHKNVPVVASGVSTLSSGHSCSKTRVSARYPFSMTRMYMKNYFGILPPPPPREQNMLERLPDPVRRITATNAEKYLFLDESGLNCIGAEAFVHLLARYGASVQYTSREWVTNHYKWIVWKLACYERCYSFESFGKLLTVSNVFEELKYRYEREVNHGHRSAIKRILEGDASSSSMVILCISAILLNCEPNMETASGAETSSIAKVELTDGWYSVDAVLDTPLSKQLASGKLFVGQKLRIWGAVLCGWTGPVSPLELQSSRTVTLGLHINGTYRSHWADRLGFCKGVGAPLAFSCVKNDGGPIPCTLLGVTRIYPVLYKERLNNGRSIVRSERLETKMVESYQQRRSNVIEGIISEFQRGIEHSHMCDDSDSEGAKLLKILQTAAEPEYLMAEMTTEQLKTFTRYRAKLEAIKQSDMEKSIMKALEDASLGERDVTPFMRVRVVGLTRKLYQGKSILKEGIVTIWNPSEKQRSELDEGHAYSVSGLIPTNSDVNILHLLARGSSTDWTPLSQQAKDQFKPFFRPRKSVLLSDLGKVPLSSEFDIAALVLFVGKVYVAGHQKKQWAFVTDSSLSISKSEELCDSLLAICFCSPFINNDSDALMNSNLAGSVVGFSNLTKGEKDKINSLWVAEATESSAYFLSFDTSYSAHLEDAATSTEKWKRISSLNIDRLKQRVLSIIGDSTNG